MSGQPSTNWYSDPLGRFQWRREAARLDGDGPENYRKERIRWPRLRPTYTPLTISAAERHHYRGHESGESNCW